MYTMSSTLIIPAEHLFEITEHDEVILDPRITVETVFNAQMKFTDDNQHIPNGEITLDTYYNVCLNYKDIYSLDLLTKSVSDPIYGVTEKCVSQFSYTGFHSTCLKIAKHLGLTEGQYEII